MALALVATALLTGCAGDTAPLMPAVPSFPTYQSLAATISGAPQKGVVVVSGGIAELACAEAHVVIARDLTDGGYGRVADAVLPTTYGSDEAFAVVELDPGAYRIVHYACRNGLNVSYVGPNGTPGSVPWTGDAWQNALASFTVGPGETVDIGALRLSPELVTARGKDEGKAGKDKKKRKKERKARKPAGQTVALAVETMTEAARTRLAADDPGLAGRLVARPMTVEPGAAGFLERCTLEDGSKVAGVDVKKATDVRRTKKKGAEGVLGAMASQAMTPTGCKPAGKAVAGLGRMLGQ
ncbi:MAG: hypothetical protein R3D33_14140 [Hyphomicrobiaceae bacterium]